MMAPGDRVIFWGVGGGGLCMSNATVDPDQNASNIISQPDLIVSIPDLCPLSYFDSPVSGFTRTKD